MLQALAVEKLLMVTSTVQPSRAPPERPTLASLPPVNENPSPPVMPTANGPVRVRDPQPQVNGCRRLVTFRQFSAALWTCQLAAVIKRPACRKAFALCGVR